MLSYCGVSKITKTPRHVVETLQVSAVPNIIELKNELDPQDGWNELISLAETRRGWAHKIVERHVWLQKLFRQVCPEPCVTRATHTPRQVARTLRFANGCVDRERRYSIKFIYLFSQKRATGRRSPIESGLLHPSDCSCFHPFLHFTEVHETRRRTGICLHHVCNCIVPLRYDAENQPGAYGRVSPSPDQIMN